MKTITSVFLPNFNPFFTLIGLLLIVALSTPHTVYANGFESEAASYYSTYVVPYLKGFALLSAVCAVFLLIAGKPEGWKWGSSVCIGLVVATKLESIIKTVWTSFRSGSGSF